VVRRAAPRVAPARPGRGAGDGSRGDIDADDGRRERRDGDGDAYPVGTPDGLSDGDSGSCIDLGRDTGTDKYPGTEWRC
jgi:hypothetical protein